MTVCHVNWEVRDDGKISTITIRNRIKDLLYEVRLQLQSMLEPVQLSRLTCPPERDMTGGSHVQIQGGRPVTLPEDSNSWPQILNSLVTLVMGYYYLVLVCTISQGFFSPLALLCSSQVFSSMFDFLPMKYFVYSVKIYLKHSSCRVCPWSTSDPVQLFFFPLHSSAFFGLFCFSKGVLTGTLSERETFYSA